MLAHLLTRWANSTGASLHGAETILVIEPVRHAKAVLMKPRRFQPRRGRHLFGYELARGSRSRCFGAGKDSARDRPCRESRHDSDRSGGTRDALAQERGRMTRSLGSRAPRQAQGDLRRGWIGDTERRRRSRRRSLRRAAGRTEQRRLHRGLLRDKRVRRTRAAPRSAPCRRRRCPRTSREGERRRQQGRRTSVDGRRRNQG